MAARRRQTIVDRLCGVRRVSVVVLELRLLLTLLLLFLCFKYIFMSIVVLIFDQYLLNKVDTR